MFSQEDLETYNRVQNAMELQERMQAQNRRRGRVARILAAVFIVLFLAASATAGFLGNSLYSLNNDYSELRGDFARVVADHNESVATIEVLNDDLSQANQNVHTLNAALGAEREERNRAVNVLSENVASLARQIEDERAEYNRGIAGTNQAIAEKEEEKQEWIDHYAGINADLENTIIRLESSNSSLSQDSRQLIEERNSIIQLNKDLDAENRRLADSVETLTSRVSVLESEVIKAKSWQINIPVCASNYYVKVGENTLACAQAPGG